MATADSGCSEAQAVSAASQLLNAGAVAVVGHICSAESLAAQPVYSAAGVPMISPASTQPLLTQRGYTNTFRTVSPDSAPASLMATYLRNWLHLSKSATVIASQMWPEEIAEAYEDTFTLLGGTIATRRTVSGTGDFVATLTAIQAEGAEVVFYIDDNPERAGQFSLAAVGLGMSDLVIAWDSLDPDKQVLVRYASAAGPLAAEGDYAVMFLRSPEDMPGWAAFLTAYRAAQFANVPDDPGHIGAFAYDAARIVISAIERAGSADPLAIRDQIAEIRNYSGVVGLYGGFDANGDVNPPWCWLERYQDGNWLSLQPTRLALPIVINRHN